MKLYFIIYITIIFILSCSSNENKIVSNVKDTVVYVTDSIDPYGYKVVKYGNDSIYAYKGDKLKSIQYLSNTSSINRKIFNDEGFLDRIRYNWDSLPSIDIEYLYPLSGKIHYQNINVDTIIITAGCQYKCFELKKEYYENGQLKAMGYNGYAGPWMAYIGLWTYYNQEGKMDKSINYIYPTKGKPYFIECQYYINGKMKCQKIFINSAFYEGEEVIPIGTWKYYDEQGKLIRTKKYTNFNIN